MRIIFATTVSRSLCLFQGAIEDLREEHDICLASSGEKMLKSFAEEMGVRSVFVPMERRISPLKDLRSLWLMLRFLRRERPRMVHSMTPKAGLITMMAAWLARVPIRIHTFTGLIFPTSTGLKRRILMATDWLTCACATHIIPEGEGVKGDLLNHGITKKQIRVLGHGNVRGIDLNYYNPTEQNVDSDDKIFTFVFVGRLVGDKGINELVTAFKRLNIERPNTRLVLVGGKEANLDPLRSETTAEIESNPAIENVGRQSDVRPFYAAADALVFPSYREGFPNVVIEAGAMGLPSIVTDINGSREIIIEGENGTIIPSKDADALYDAMKRFVENPDEVKRMAANARPLIASRYEQSYVRQCLKEFYKECIESISKE